MRSSTQMLGNRKKTQWKKSYNLWAHRETPIDSSPIANEPSVSFIANGTHSHGKAEMFGSGWRERWLPAFQKRRMQGGRQDAGVYPLGKVSLSCFLCKYKSKQTGRRLIFHKERELRFDHGKYLSPTSLHSVFCSAKLQCKLPDGKATRGNSLWDFLVVGREWTQGHQTSIASMLKIPETRMHQTLPKSRCIFS